MGVPEPISIHAPLTGCDRWRWRCTAPRPDFNPRTPRGVRLAASVAVVPAIPISIHAPLAGCDPGDAGDLYALWGISIHAPLAGCDHKLTATIKNIDISIHAPLTGCDVTGVRRTKPPPNFNPRTPYGVRHPGSIRGLTTSSYFNPRTPYGVRPSLRRTFHPYG